MRYCELGLGWQTSREPGAKLGILVRSCDNARSLSRLPIESKNNIGANNNYPRAEQAHELG